MAGQGREMREVVQKRSEGASSDLGTAGVLPNGSMIRLYIAAVDGEKRDDMHREVSFDDLRDPALLRTLAPVRVVRALRQMKSRARYQPIVSLGITVACESRLEAVRVMQLDRTGELTWLVAQPFWLEVARSGKRPMRHAPDLLYGTRSGEIALENVRPQEMRDEQFERKSQVCQRLARHMNWSYRASGGDAPMMLEMTQHLRLYAGVTPRPAVVERIHEAFGERPSWSLRSLCARCNVSAADYPTLLALLWRGVLTVDMEHPLLPWSVIQLGWSGR